jgi:poly(3-hydroxybutyrate) depolymerase
MTEMKLLLVTLVLALLAQEAPAPLPSKGKGGPAGTFENEKLKVGDQEREFRLVVPEGLDPAKPVPLVFAFHGKGDNKAFICRYSGFEELAGKNGFIAVFPQAVEKEWELRATDDNPDLKFFDALFDHITSKYNVDLRRVYLTGMSMGAYFSNLLASKRSERIAAIAPHSGGLGVLAFRGIKAKRKYAVMIVHGDADRIVKVEEGRTSRDAYKKEGHPVEYVEVPGLGHVWARKEDITARMWKFFMANPLK